MRICFGMKGNEMLKMLMTTVAIAAIAANVGCRVTKPSGLYEAVSEFTIDMRRTCASNGQDGASANDGQRFAELFNTRIHEWRSEKVVWLILQQFRMSHPELTVADDELVETLSGSELKLQGDSRVVSIVVRARNPVVAAALANAYAAAIEKYTEEQSRARCDMAVAGLHANVEKKRREVDRLSLQLLNFRTDNKLDTLRESRDIIRQGLEKATADILALESQEVQLDKRRDDRSAEDTLKLESIREQLKEFRKKQSDLRSEFASVEQRIILAESGIAQLEAELGVAQHVLESLILEENKVRIQGEGNNEIIRVGRPAVVPNARKSTGK